MSVILDHNGDPVTIEPRPDRTIGFMVYEVRGMEIHKFEEGKEYKPGPEDTPIDDRRGIRCPCQVR